MIKYKRAKDFEVDQVKLLFSSGEWFSGNFPEKLQIAYSTILLCSCSKAIED